MAFAGEKCIDAGLIQQVKFLMRSRQDVPISLALQFALNGRAHQTTMASDIDTTVRMHKRRSHGVLTNFSGIN